MTAVEEHGPNWQRGQREHATAKTARTRAAITAAIDASGPDGIQAQSIARRTGLARGTVVRVLNDLIGLGLVSRRPDPFDSRAIRYRLKAGQ